MWLRSVFLNITTILDRFGLLVLNGGSGLALRELRQLVLEVGELHFVVVDGVVTGLVRLFGGL